MPGARLGQPQPEAAVAPDPHQLGSPPRPAAEIGDAHDLELEPLGAMDRHQPHRVERLALDRRLALARLAGPGAGAEAAAGAPGDEVEESAQVGPVRRLVLAREAHQLAHVGQPPLPARHREHGQVVARPLERAVDQPLGAGAGGHLALDGEPVGEPTE